MDSTVLNRLVLEVQEMNKDKLRQLALSFRAIDGIINSRGVRLNTKKNRAKRLRRKDKHLVLTGGIPWIVKQH